MFNKIKLSQEQDTMVLGISKELGVPKEEVVWVLVELGAIVCVWSQQDDKILDIIKQTGEDIPEYKNWERIAKSLTEAFRRGSEELKNQ